MRRFLILMLLPAILLSACTELANDQQVADGASRRWSPSTGHLPEAAAAVGVSTCGKMAS
jgi:hypothetical protein